jgi:hypothetical protein
VCQSNCVGTNQRNKKVTHTQLYEMMFIHLSSGEKKIKQNLHTMYQPQCTNMQHYTVTDKTIEYDNYMTNTIKVHLPRILPTPQTELLIIYPYVECFNM